LLLLRPAGTILSEARKNRLTDSDTDSWCFSLIRRVSVRRSEDITLRRLRKDPMNVTDFTWYKGNLDWLKRRTIFLCRSGSHAYGTNIATSDEDYKGVAIPPKRYFLGFLNRFESVETRIPVDITIYDLRKFAFLASSCNPNIIEILYTNEADWILVNSYWKAFVEKREMFVTKVAKDSFSGYAMAQLKRIKSHKRWLLDPPKAHPERKDFGLPAAPTIPKEQFGIIEARIRKLEDGLGGEGWTKDRVDEIDENLVLTVAGEVNLTPDLTPIIMAERKYKRLMRNWIAFCKWKEERNEVRAELERKHGYDSKHAMHLVRLMRMAIEILRDGQVIVRRPDAEELLSIRNGLWSYEKLMEWAQQTEVTLHAVAAESKLPTESDPAAIDRLLVSVIETYLSNHPS
jgi:uncharacterized protein